MMKKKALFFVTTQLVVLACIVSIAAAAPRIDKGPYVILDRSGARVVKVQSNYHAPQLMYYDATGAIAARDMIAAAGSLYELPIPDEAIAYRVIRAGEVTPWKALKPTPKAGESFRLVAYGDNRTGRSDRGVHRSLIRAMDREAPDMVINSGDLVARGESAFLWQRFFEEIEPIAGSYPYIAAIGNHDESRDKWFARYFRSGEDKNYLAIPVAGGFVILLDAIVNVAEDDEQRSFLIEALKRAEGSSPIIVVLHKSPFSWGKHGDDAAIIEHWVPLFSQYGVDLVISGHDHDYQRIGPVHGVDYIVTGGGGAPVYGVEDDPQVKKAYEGHHYVVLEINKGLIRGWVKDMEGNVLDEFELNLQGGGR